MMKKASIIIRTKNEEKWISICLNAIFKQDYKNFEVIIVDNCSTDKTVEKAKEWNVKVVTLKEFKPGNAINYGIENSSGDYLICLSAPVSYTHLTLPTIYSCRSRWSPYH